MQEESPLFEIETKDQIHQIIHGSGRQANVRFSLHLQVNPPL